MQEDLENKSVTLIINTSKLTARTLATAFMKLLRFSAQKVKEHHDAQPHGKQTVKQLIGQNQGVESTDLNDKAEAKKFDRYAKQYGVDYAIKKSVSNDGKTRFICFFKGRDRSAVEQLMRAYGGDWLKQQAQEQTPVEQVPDPQKELKRVKKKVRVKQKGLER